MSDKLFTTTGLLQELQIAAAVAAQVKGRSWGTSLALKSLFTRLSKESHPGIRLAATEALLAWGSAERWGQAWMLDALSELRNDEDAGVSAAAFAEFCFAE